MSKPRVVARRAGRRRVRRVALVGGLTLLLAGGSAGAWAATSGDDGGSYRTATVSRATVQQQLDLTGVVKQVNQASAEFPVTGTVASVAVGVGDRVTAGQELARLRTDDLQAAVTEAAANLAKAKATLETDETPATASTSTASTSTAKPGGTTAKPSGAQRAVTSAQRAADRSLKAANAALATQKKACAAVTSSKPAPTGSPKPAARPSGTPTPTATPTPGTPGGGDALARCLTALTNTQRAQAKLATDQATLAKAAGAWAAELSKAAAATGSGAAAGSTGATSGSTGAASGSAGARATTETAGGQTVSASRIAQDKAEVATAQSELDRANENLAAAKLTAPIGGTVGTIGMTAGTAIRGGEQIVIIGVGAVKVTVNVPLASIRKVKVGQPAAVTPDGATTAVDGTVQSIGLLPSAASTGASTGGASASTSSGVAYPVVVLVDRATPALAAGSQAGVSITVGSTGTVLTVPNSAVTSTGTGTGVVTMLVGGVATRKIVQVGAVGSLRTEITSGVTPGQQVVLADLSRELPTSSATTNRGGFAPGGQGGPPGGFTRSGTAPR